jgi:hypothetical protein
MALTPLAVLAADTSPEHEAAELANAEEQFVLAEQEASDLQAQADASAANERMVALLRSEAMRERELDMVANATAMEQIAAALANAARADGELNARNELAIAQLKAATLVSVADANLANGIMLAQTRGRLDEEANARAQSELLHQVADFISGRQAELNMANAREIAQEDADAIHGPALVEQQNEVAIGADELFAADDVVTASQDAAKSAQISGSAKASALLNHAAASLANARAMSGQVVAEEPAANLVADEVEDSTD